MLYRRGAGERGSRKRQTPARMPPRLLAHLRRWHGMGGVNIVSYQGGGIGDVRTAFALAVERAGLEGVTPHTLKHTAITWAMQRGATIWDAASYFGTSAETIERVYGHHHPDHQKSATRAAGGRN